MKPFNIEAAKRGEPVCTADGREVRLYAFDAPTMVGDTPQPIAGVMAFGTTSPYWTAASWSVEGFYHSNGSATSDLRMASRKEKRWIVSWTGKYGSIHAEGHDIKLEAEHAYQRFVASTSAFKNVTLTEVEVEL